jgi:cell division protein YceG involved in septum cleavage
MGVIIMLNFIWKRFSYVIILLILGVASFSIFLIHVSSQPEYEQITVKQGDTLWTIAERYEGSHSMTSEEFIDWIGKENNLSTFKITEGESLTLPVTEKAIKHNTDVQLALNED